MNFRAKRKFLFSPIFIPKKISFFRFIKMVALVAPFPGYLITLRTYLASLPAPPCLFL